MGASGEKTPLRAALYELRQRAADEANDGPSGDAACSRAATAYGWLGDTIEAFIADRETAIPSAPEAKGEAGAGPVGEAVAVSRSELQEACDLLAERKYGSPARSPAHNARLVIERILARPVEEPGEVERLTRERDAAMKAATHWQDRYRDAATAFDRPDLGQRLTVHRRIDAEAALAETRDRLEKREEALREIADGDIGILGPEAHARAALSTQESSAALSGDGKEVAR